jgi:hypothetical protein
MTVILVTGKASAESVLNEGKVFSGNCSVCNIKKICQ